MSHTDNKLEAQFRAFHAKNPHIYVELVKLARQAKDAGWTKAGIGMLYEVVRWNVLIGSTDRRFKMTNNHRAYYSRLMMAQEEDLAGFFDMRELAPTGSQVSGDETDDPNAHGPQYPTTP
jgi:hypothetical protein